MLIIILAIIRIIIIIIPDTTKRLRSGDEGSEMRDEGMWIRIYGLSWDIPGTTHEIVNGG